MNAIHRHDRARQDLVDIFRYYSLEAGLRVAKRFFAQVEATFARLAGMPGMGSHYDLDHPALADLRFFPVSRFRKYLVFYSNNWCRSIFRVTPIFQARRVPSPIP